MKNIVNKSNTLKNPAFMILLIAAFFMIIASVLAVENKGESGKDFFKINIDGIKDIAWGNNPVIANNSKAAKPESFNLDKGLYISENKKTLFLGIEVDPDPIDGQRISEMQILIGREGKAGGVDDPYNFDADHIKYAGFAPYIVIPIQWDSNNGGKIMSAGFVSWDADSQKWKYGDFSGVGKIGAGGGTGVGIGDTASKIAKENTWLEISLSKSLLKLEDISGSIKVAVILKSDSRSSGACSSIPDDDAFVSDYGVAKSSVFSAIAEYAFIANPLPEEVIGFSNYLMAYIDFFSQWCIPLLIFIICVYAYIRKVKVYEVFVTGAKEGFSTAIMIIPYLVAILFAIGMFRAGGAEQIVTDFIKPLTSKLGIPSSILPLMIIRPLSGGGARGVMLDIFKQYGPDSIDGLIASCIQGSTETTFYVIAVYLGSIGVRKTRYAIPVCLFGDLIGFLASVVICNWIFGASGLN